MRRRENHYAFLMSLLGLLFPLTVLACILSGAALVLNAGWNLFSGRISPFTNCLIAVFLGGASIMGGIISYIAAVSGKSEDFVRELTGPEAWSSWLFLFALLGPHLLWLAVFRSPLRAALIAFLCIAAAAPEFRSIMAAA